MVEGGIRLHEYNRYKSLLLEYLKIVAEKQPFKAIDLVKKDYYPIEQSLSLCESYHIIDA